MPTESAITVRRDIPAPATDIFAVLSNPAQHVKLDASGFVQGVDHADRIASTGQTFRMNMSGDHMGGDYQTDNVVSGFEQGKLIAWKTAPAGSEPPGWEWLWELDPQGPDT
ncbi:MAG: polyketide cyclase, partial [Nocardioidaceae bacterium]|nr:polyketide cyclase [Nocardioidaceae bacterium]